MIGDTVVALNGKKLDSMQDLHDLLTDEWIGKELAMGMIRAGKLQELKLKVGERPIHRNK
jgi:S1-C subfamily serine protease